MASLWEDLHLPILRVLETSVSMDLWPELDDIREMLEEREAESFSPNAVMIGLVDLAEAEPPFIKAKFIRSAQASLPLRALDVRLTERGYRAVGAWPSADPYDQLMNLLAERIESEDQPEVKGKLERFRESVQGIGRDVVVGVLTSLAKESAGLP